MMQIEKMTQQHYEYLLNEFGVTKEQFKDMCNKKNEEFDNLFDELTWKECDAAEEYAETGEYSETGKLPIEIIDFICGPYDDVIDEV